MKVKVIIDTDDDIMVRSSFHRKLKGYYLNFFVEADTEKELRKKLNDFFKDLKFEADESAIIYSDGTKKSFKKIRENDFKKLIRRTLKDLRESRDMGVHSYCCNWEIEIIPLSNQDSITI